MTVRNVLRQVMIDCEVIPERAVYPDERQYIEHYLLHYYLIRVPRNCPQALPESDQGSSMKCL